MSYEALVHAHLIVLSNGLGENAAPNVLHSSHDLTILVQKMVVLPFGSYYDAIHVIHAISIFQFGPPVVALVDDAASSMSSMKAVAQVLSAHSTRPDVYPGHPGDVHAYLLSSSVSSVRSRSRARLRRDFTVPIGHPSTDAISLSVKSAP
jgi:hypothetical protein